MSKFIIPFLIVFSNILYSQIPVTFSDEFNLTYFPEYDNWTYQQETFFVLPLSLNEFISIQSLEFNIKYDPQLVEPMIDLIGIINSPNFTVPLSVSNALTGIAGTTTAQSFNVSAEIGMLSVSYINSTSSFTQEQYNNNGEILMYIPFKKLNACNKAPFYISFWDGNDGESYINPNQTNSIIINQSLSEESGNIFTQDAVITFNVLSASVEQLGNAFHPTISGGTPPYLFEWTDKMDVVLSTDSIYYPLSSADYLFYVYDANQCESILFLTFDESASIVKPNKLKKIYPNPAINDVTITTQKLMQYQLYDLRGRPLRSGQISPSFNKIERNQLPSGTFFLILQTESTKDTYIVTFI